MNNAIPVTPFGLRGKALLDYFTQKCGSKRGKQIYKLKQAEEQQLYNRAREAFYQQKIDVLRRRIAGAANVVASTQTQARGRGTGVQTGKNESKTASSGDGDGSDGEPPRSLTPLVDTAAFAAFLGISKKTFQNKFSQNPNQFPPAVAVPGARGPRWTLSSVQAWLADRPQYTPPAPPPPPTAQKRKVGRPRLAVVARRLAAGGAA